MKLPWLNTTPVGVTLYIIELINSKERFIKIGVSKLIELKYASFRNCGYRVNEIERFTFNDLEAAQIELYKLSESLSGKEWIPLHQFNEPEYCYNPEILTRPFSYQGGEITEITEIYDEIPLEEKVLKMLASGEKGKEIAMKLKISEVKVSRIKNKRK
jgi:hypothetical protein